MAGPSALSLAEIRDFMLKNNCKVTNHALVKHFKKFLTDPNSQDESRKQFKTYVNILSTIKNQGSEKFLILRKKYINECPSEDTFSMSDISLTMSPGARSLNSDDGSSSPQLRQPPPYKAPPVVAREPFVVEETTEHYQECVDEFKGALVKIGRKQSLEPRPGPPAPPLPPPPPPPMPVVDLRRAESPTPAVPPRRRSSTAEPKTPSRQTSVDVSESITEKSVDLLAEEKSAKNAANSSENKENESSKEDMPVSVKEATKKFNRIVSQEEEAAKTSSPSAKKKPEKEDSNNNSSENLLSHPKSKEWLVVASRSNYQEMAKIASEFPKLVNLQDPTTGYTALHWAAKHGNEDAVKLIAGTHKADVHMRTNGGYTPLHLAMQFERDNIFELLCNVYKADRNITDWSGMKPLDYRKQKTTVSASTYNKIKERKKQQAEKDLGFLRIGSLNVRVKKTTEAFTNILGLGSSSNSSSSNALSGTTQSQSQIRHHHNRKENRMKAAAAAVRSSVPANKSDRSDKMNKIWGSADNLPSSSVMPPPKQGSIKKRRHKRSSNIGDVGGYSSVPTTPNQVRSTICELPEHTQSAGDSDSDSAFGFGSNWKGGKRKDGGKYSEEGIDKPTYI